MGREVRMVPPDWEHPVDHNGRYKPLHGDYARFCAYWCDDFYRRRNQSMSEVIQDMAEDPPPKREDFMPDFKPGTATHYRMYETTSEGTPISPAMPTPEDLARWLADNGASSFGDQTATYEQWLGMIQEGWAPSAVYYPGSGLQSGVAAFRN